MTDTPADALKRAVLRIKAIGEEIAALSKESKRLRADAATLVNDCGLGQVAEDQPIEFLMDSLVVSVVKAKGEKDFTVTFKELKAI